MTRKTAIVPGNKSLLFYFMEKKNVKGYFSSLKKKKGNEDL
jgi:hypothetical protein